MDTSVDYAINYPSSVMCKLRKTNHSTLLSEILEKKIAGDIVEIGSYAGEGSTMVISAVMEKYSTDKVFHIYDSFQGLPEPNVVDYLESEKDLSLTVPLGSYSKFAQNLVGMFSSPRDVLQKNVSHFKNNVEIHEGWINDTLPNTLPDKICYAHIDCDLYEPILFSLETIYNKLTSGAICIIDDYKWLWFPGATKAVDDFMSNKSEKLNVLPNTIHAYFTKI